MQIRRGGFATGLILAVSMAASALPAPTLANGFIAHKHITQQAWDSFPDPVIKDLLATRSEIVLTGALFPDAYFQTSLAFLSEAAWSHDAHTAEAPDSHPFREAFLEHLRSDSMTSAQRLDAIAFLLGQISHHSADERFDAGLLTAATPDAWGSCAVEFWLAPHSKVDLAFDWCVQVTYGVVGLGNYPFPTVTILNAYRTLGLTPDQVNEVNLAKAYWGGDAIYWDGFASRVHIMEESAINHCGRSLFVEANYNWRDYPNGGLIDLIDYVSDQWQAFLTQDEPTTTLTLSPPAPDGSNGAYTQPVTVTVTASKGFGELASTCILDGGSPTPVAGPIEISAGGAHTLSCYSTDVTTRAGTPQSVTLSLDLPKDSSGGCGCGTGTGGLGLLALVGLLALAPRSRTQRFKARPH